MKKSLLLSVIVFSILISHAQENRMIPSMIVTNTNGKQMPLSDYVAEDGFTVFYFWQSCCPTNISCLIELDSALSDYDGNKSISVVTVALDDSRSANKIKPIVKGKGINLPTILDVNSDIKRTMNVNLVPCVIVSNKNKEIVFESRVSSDGDISILFDKINKL